jgi:hypothetical protein
MKFVWLLLGFIGLLGQGHCHQGINESLECIKALTDIVCKNAPSWNTKESHCKDLFVQYCLKVNCDNKNCYCIDDQSLRKTYVIYDVPF